MLTSAGWGFVWISGLFSTNNTVIPPHRLAARATRLTNNRVGGGD